MTRPVQIIGQPGAGKTTLVAALVRLLTARGLRVGTLKHSSHSHELDKPGKDSHIHRAAGACPAAMVTASMAAVFLPASEQTRPENLIRQYFRDLDLVLIEGWLSGPWPKIEIWREETGRPPLFSDPRATMDWVKAGIRAVATPDPLPPDAVLRAGELQIQVLNLGDPDRIADLAMALSQG